MVDNAFFDTSALIGYCVLLNQHHRKCDNFISSNPNATIFASRSVEMEYARKKSSICNRLERDVLDHVRDIQRNAPSGYLDPMDINQIQTSILAPNNDAYQFLYDYYSKVKSSGLNKSQLTSILRSIARSIHVIADHSYSVKV